jgi:hypothetical protein
MSPLNRKMLHGLLVISLLLLPAAISQPVLAESPPAVDGTSLIEQAKAMDGLDVQYSGEVIGDIMVRGDHYWINVLDQGTAIGIWITAPQRAQIKQVGRYGCVGDQVTLVGRFNRACSQHGGDLDIHAVSLAVIQSGYTVDQPVSGPRLLGAFILLTAALVSLLILFLPKIRKKNGLVAKQAVIKPK